MASFYNIDYNDVSDKNNVPDFRKPKWRAWLGVLMKPIVFLNQRTFIDYTDGTNYPTYNNSSTYNFGDIVQYGYGNYYCLADGTTGIKPVINSSWYKLQDNFVGYLERRAYTGQKLSMEYALNRYFGVATFSTVQWDDGVVTAPPYTQIYITNSGNTNSNFWLSNGTGLNSYMANNSVYQSYYLGNSYSAYSPYSFTIHVPTSVQSAITAILPPGATVDQQIRAQADKLCECDKNYNIIYY